MQVYLDNAASTPLDPEALEAMMPYFRDHYGNPSSTHNHGRRLRVAIEKARKTIADLMGCSPGEIIFTSGGTEADNTVLRGLVRELGIRHLITSPIEHPAVLKTAEHLSGCESVQLHMLIPDTEGRLDLDELRRILEATGGQGEPTLVSLMHGNNEIGTLNDLAAIGTLCQDIGACFHSDTVQTVGHQPFDLKSLPVSSIVASAHKFHGPKGVGFYYRAAELQCPAFMTGGGQERNLRAGTENVAGIVGMAAALEKVSREHSQRQETLRHLKALFIQQVRKRIPGVQFNGVTEIGESLDTVVNVAFPLEETESMLMMNLDIAGISASGGSACSSGSVSGSHVLRALGHAPARVANSVRFSFSPLNTPEEIAYTVDQLQKTVVGEQAAVR